MRRQKWLYWILILPLLLGLSACADVASIPNVAVSHDGQWVAFLASEEFASRFSLKALNMTDNTVVNIGAEGHQQGAFAWHPTQATIAYFNLDADGVPTIQTSDMATPDQGVNVFGALAFPSSFWVNQMAYAPDGNTLAMTVLLLPFGAVIDPNQPYSASEVSGALYLGNMQNGELATIVPSGVYPTTLRWSPDGSKLAYMAWADDNQDGLIDIRFDPAIPYSPDGDRFRVFVYDVASGTTNPINDPTHMHSSPTWLDNNRLVLVASEPTVPANNSLIVYDVTTQQVTPVVAADGQHTILAVNASPDGTRLAYTRVIQANGMAITQPSSIVVVNADGSNPQEVYMADGATGVLDVAVWSLDGASLFVSTANPPSAKLTAFAEYDETLTPQSLVQVDIASGTATSLYTGTMTSSGFLQANLGQ